MCCIILSMSEFPVPACWDRGRHNLPPVVRSWARLGGGYWLHGGRRRQITTCRENTLLMGHVHQDKCVSVLPRPPGMTWVGVQAGPTKVGWR